MSNENKEPQQQHPPPDPLRAEAQLYQRMEQARAQIASAVNKTMQDAGLPTAIVLELLRGIVSETTLTLERTAHGATKVELEELKKVEKEKAGSSDKP